MTMPQPADSVLGYTTAPNPDRCGVCGMTLPCDGSIGHSEAADASDDPSEDACWQPGSCLHTHDTREKVH